MTRWLAVLVLVVVAAGSCNADEGDSPDVTPLPALSTVVPTDGRCDGSAPEPSDVAACLAAATTSTTSTTVASSADAPPPSSPPPAGPPATCGPDPDEQHGPPCD